LPIRAADFQFVRETVLREASIVLEPGREYLVESRLLSLTRQEDFPSLDELIEKAKATRDSRLIRLIVEAMTTNETSFFRDPAYFTAIKDKILPELIKKRQAERKLTIWCAASASGQEPYSLAMILNELAPQLAGFRVSLIATDFCEKMVERSRAGVYSQVEVNRGLPTKLLVSWFERQGSDFKVKAELKRNIEFKTMNLATAAWPAMPPCDLVLMRNVLIYFSVDTKREVFARIKRLMRSDGVLVLGSTETTFNVDPSFERFEAGSASFHRIRES